MSDLLKSRSPAPFSLSTSPNDRGHAFSGNATHDDLSSSFTEILSSLNRSLPLSNVSNVTSDSGYDARDERGPTDLSRMDGHPSSSDNGQSTASFLTAPEVIDDRSPSSAVPPSTSDTEI
ncbi:unnamed protein product, partial [Strongylus vulgaris]